MLFNQILLSDSYKVSHHKQTPPDAEGFFSHFLSRGGRFPYTVFMGLQGILIAHLSSPLTLGDIADAQAIIDQHMGKGVFNRGAWEHIVRDHHGCLPLVIKAVPEGTHVENGNVLMTVESTCPRCGWLVGYMETLLVQTWYPTTVCTQSNAIRNMISRFMRQTCDTMDGLPFKLHDFGFRGVSSVESAAIGGCAHLVNFRGTDTMVALQYAQAFYWPSAIAGFSIPAAEHSTITSWGRDGELQAYRNMIQQFPTGLVAVVSDSYDIRKACDEYWGQALKDEVLARKGTVVIRPDSGRPVEVVQDTLDILMRRFGYAINSKGYKVLPAQVRVIQGDGVNYESINEILTMMMNRHWSIDNIAFGMGGALLQNLTRDTQKFAFKCAAVQRKGEWLPVYKDPVTDPGKRSRAGRMKLVRKQGWEDRVVGQSYETVDESDPRPNVLATVYENGFITTQTLDQIRKRATGDE